MQSTRRAYLSSYRKTTGMALAGAVVSAVLSYTTLSVGEFPGSRAVAALLALGCALCALVFLGGVVVLYRDNCDVQGRPDIFNELFHRVPRSTAHGWRKWLRAMLGPGLRPGDLVLVRSPGEILAVLDESGTTDGLPFMPEMHAFCGATYLVDRRIEKINDWIGGAKLRRVEGVVSLVDVRCGGGSHGDCQAACQILWNERWLRRVSVPPGRVVPATECGEADRLDALLGARARQTVRRNGGTVEKYVCQITELLHVSRPMRTWDIRQDIRPLLAGNIGPRAFLVAVLTALFNRVQALRFGSGYPVMAAQLENGPTPVERLDLMPGELVRVRSKEEIGRTLVKGHNRGMWFGKETARHCGRQYRVRGRVERIIDERSGEMLNMKTPAIILDGVTGTGELVRFSPQNDYVFWREIWLRRVDED